MSDTTYQHPIPRPTGPRKRESLPRMTLPVNDANMAKKRDKSKITPPHSTPNKGVKSPKLDEESKKYKEALQDSKIYPDLEADLFNLDESITSTAGSYSHRSSSDTHTTDSLISDCSYNRWEYTPESSRGTVSLGTAVQSNAPSRLDGHKRPGLSFGISFTSFVRMIIIGLIISICVQGRTLISNKPVKRSDIEIERLRQNITVLKGLFPSQDGSTWRSFGTGIQDVLMEEPRPAIFCLIALHDQTTECLAKRVAELASATLGGAGDVILTPDEFENNKSKVFDLMEKRMRQTKAVVVPDLLSLQPEAIKAFHDICDQYNPLIAEAVYLFTMKSRNNVKSTDLANFVNEQMRQKFDNVINKDTLQALFTRITAGEVLFIKEEKEIPCST